MNSIRVLILLAGLIAAPPAFSQKQELGLTLGRLLETSRGSPSGRLDLKSGLALQANYGYRVGGLGAAAIYVEVHLLANPLRDVTSLNRAATRDFATLYVTPGLRVKFAPSSRFSPYLAAGGGYALYEQSTSTIAGQMNPATPHIQLGAVHFGGGANYSVRPWLGFPDRGSCAASRG